MVNAGRHLLYCKVDELRNALTVSKEGTIISIEVTSNAKKTRFPSGYNSWRRSIGCQIREPPVEGKANLAIVKVLAAFFSLPAERIYILSGAGASQKKILLGGMHIDTVMEILNRTQCTDH